ncbi:universal stress protein [Thiohalocapsa marina]|uniref:Universal stress protein n=1 Tax=Thiohalocapsa marina TaxID=424902 RepID=A0A5M8FL91_9GAMM|nr:universal stress protein [Thiohalocapsa marina]KAA6185264.1 universal stress protein [Thiohalocapsa marina]
MSESNQDEGNRGQGNRDQGNGDQGYRHILLAVDFAPESEVVTQRALTLRARFDARLTLVNIVDYVPPGADYAAGAFVAEPVLPEEFQLEQELIDVARRELDRLGERIGVPPEGRIVEFGSAGRSIEHVAKDLGVDLIVVGARDHNWLSSLFGSTPRTLLRHEVCDLLAVRIPQPAED